MAQEQNQTILPKGIVLNRNTIYQEIAKYDVIPVEQILRACHVFSTTSRKLYDPTARRLENFWTRMLGGDRRYLSGRVVAHLFREISEGAPFVKLRGPINRYEPPSPKSSSSNPQSIPVTSGASMSKPKSNSATSSTKILHPILKKPRGPSASGPRPTARFVSPPGSEVDESSGKGSGTATPTQAITHNASSKDSGKPAATKDERKKGQVVKPKKKTTAFVASTSSRRRPAMPRRSSSQSSAGASDNGPKEKDSSIESRYGGSQGLVPTIPEKPEQQLADKNKGKGNVTLSAKAAGKRPVTQSQAETATSRPGTVQKGQIQAPKTQVVAPVRQDKPKIEQATPVAKVEEGSKSVGNSKDVSETPRAADQKTSPRERPGSDALSAMDIAPSAPSLARQNSREASRAIMPPSSLTSTSLTKVDTSVGQGTISGFTDNATVQDIPAGRGSGRLGGSPEAETNAQYASGSGLPPRFTPTQPANTVSIPLARTKSQLALLLEQKRPKQR